MRFASLKYFDVQKLVRGTRVLMRLDANIDPEDTHPLRIMRALAEIEDIIAHGGRIILMTHRGRPKGKEATLSTKHLVPRLESLLERPVLFISEYTREACDRAWRQNPEAILLFENLRFFEGEESNRRTFAKQLAQTADIYINNAFGVCHRKHASVHRITRYIPAYAGSVIAQELTALNAPLTQPFVFVLGGSKMKTKLPLLKKLAPSSSVVLLGSAFLLPDQVSVVARLSRMYKERIQLPVDLRIERNGHIEVFTRAQYEEEIKMHSMARVDSQEYIRCIDIGPETEMLYAYHVMQAKSIVWNGPLGVIEEEEGRNGTLSMIDALHQATQAHIVIGGGDTIAHIDTEELASHEFLSTGGGATLAYLAGATMPGLEALL